jgi:hypothetical protein
MLRVDQVMLCPELLSNDDINALRGLRAYNDTEPFDESDEGDDNAYRTFSRMPSYDDVCAVRWYEQPGPVKVTRIVRSTIIVSNR